MAMFVNQLKVMRTRKGLTQEEVAEKVGVSRQAVAKWEKGETMPDVESCICMADLYGVPLDVLARGLKAEGVTEEGKRLFGCVKMNDKGQITLPAAVRESFGLKPGSMILVLADTEKGIALVNMGDVPEDAFLPPRNDTEG